MMGLPVARSGAQEPTLALFRAPPTGGTAAIAPKAAPKSAANMCDKDTLTRCRACCAAGCGQSAPHNTSLARAYSSAATAPKHSIPSSGMPVRRGAAGTRAPPQNTHTGRTVRLCAVRIRAACRGPAPALWVLQASTRSRRARARVRVRVSQGPSLPCPVFRYTTEKARRLEGARPAERPRGPRSC